jgi:ABC-type uncharacterized transport system fused permease/ATPase subunit
MYGILISKQFIPIDWKFLVSWRKEFLFKTLEDRILFVHMFGNLLCSPKLHCKNHFLVVSVAGYLVFLILIYLPITTIIQILNEILNSLPFSKITEG